MDMLLYLYILWSVTLTMVHEISSIVPTPENISVSCHNLQTIVSWSYSKHLQETLFILNITGSTTIDKVETTETEYNVSRMIKPLDAYFVEISAVNGKGWSGSEKSQTFTFNDLKIMADIKCTLDFPPVNLAIKETKTTVSFQNPYHFYKEMRSSRWRNDNSHFEYTIQFKNRTETYVCSTDKPICEQNITLEVKRKVKYCVILEGKRKENTMIDGSVLFRRTQPICAQYNPAEDPDIMLHLISLALGLSVLVIVVCVTVFMVTKVKAYRMTSSILPKALAIFPVQHLCEPYETGDCVSVAELHVSSSQDTLLETVKETDQVESSANSSECEDSSNAPTAPSYTGRLFCRSSIQTYEVPTPIDVQSHSLLSIEDVTPAWSNYDRPQVVDMGNGDMVKTYS